MERMSKVAKTIIIAFSASKGWGLQFISFSYWSPSRVCLIGTR